MITNFTKIPIIYLSIISIIISNENAQTSIKHEYDFSCSINAYEEAKKLCNSGIFDGNLFVKCYSLGNSTKNALTKCVHEKGHIQYHEQILENGAEENYSQPKSKTYEYSISERKMISKDPTLTRYTFSLKQEVAYDFCSTNEAFNIRTTSFKKKYHVEVDSNDIIHETTTNLYTNETSLYSRAYSPITLMSYVETYGSNETNRLFATYDYSLKKEEEIDKQYNYIDDGNLLYAISDFYIYEDHEPSEFFTNITRTITLGRYAKEFEFTSIKYIHFKQRDVTYLVDYQYDRYIFE